ncbi:uncharacterized protein LOC116199899 [Punica granatum]|uniref:Uncharacterized protein LOC116199899 n=1 Tax=Punica granatum TaxID=22663 RepID=A0A6P8D4E4_PUNGR|nr:uncharacterized protein LOC116199899 [Punica granatum]XP_031386353.1 uncharacterized protein LOC116199899 [Punica granatum]
MATKMKADSAQTKLRRGPSPSDLNKRVISKPSPSVRRENSPSSSLERPVPNYLKPTISFRPETAKTVKNNGPEKTPKPSLNRRRSFDRPLPAAASPVHKALSLGPRGRSLTIKPLSSASKSTESAKPMMDAKSKSMVKAVTSRPTVSKTTKKGPTDPIINRESESSNLVGHAGDHEIDAVTITEAQADDKAPVKEAADRCEKIEDHVDVSITPLESELTDYEDTGKSLNSECQDDVMLEHHQHVSATEKGEELPGEDVLEEKINEAKHHEQGDDNHQEVESSSDVGVTETEVHKKPEEPEQKEVLMVESFQGIKGDGESMDIEAVTKEDKEKSEANEGQEVHHEEGVTTRQIAVKLEEGANAMPLKNQKSMGKKDSPVSNDVIEETASKLLEKRKNKVRALVGAFETVISLQEPEA